MSRAPFLTKILDMIVFLLRVGGPSLVTSWFRVAATEVLVLRNGESAFVVVAVGRRFFHVRTTISKKLTKCVFQVTCDVKKFLMSTRQRRSRGHGGSVAEAEAGRI